MKIMELLPNMYPKRINIHKLVLQTGENIIVFFDNATIDFIDQKNPLFNGKKIGRVCLTTHRMIFNSKCQHEPLQSFSFPLAKISDVKLEQPIFGSKYLKGKVRTQPNDLITFELHFKTGGAIEFGQALLREAKKNQPTSRFQNFSQFSKHYSTTNRSHF